MRSLWTRFCNAVLFGYLRTWLGCQQKFQHPALGLIWQQVMPENGINFFFLSSTDAILWRNDTFFLLNRDSFFAFSVFIWRCGSEFVGRSSAPGKALCNFWPNISSGTIRIVRRVIAMTKGKHVTGHAEENSRNSIALLLQFFFSATRKDKDPTTFFSKALLCSRR